MNLHRRILEEVGRKGLGSLRELEQTTVKLAGYRNHLRFNLRCLSEGLTPVSLRIKCPIPSPSAQDLIRKTETKLLNFRVRQCNFIIEKLEGNLLRQRTELEQSSITGELIQDVNKFLTHERETEHGRSQARHSCQQVGMISVHNGHELSGDSG